MKKIFLCEGNVLLFTSAIAETDEAIEQLENMFKRLKNYVVEWTS